MKTYFFRILAPAFAFAALALTAKAQATDQLNVTVPYQFVVGGKTLPAGTYRVSRANDRSQGALALSSFENRDGALIVASEWQDARGDKPSLTFEQIDGRYFLSKIATAEHVYTIPVSKSAVMLASRKPTQGSAGSTASGAN